MEKLLEELTLANVSFDMDDVQARLETVDSAMALLDDVFEDEGVQLKDNIDMVAAAAFVHRLPMLLSTYRVIQREVSAISADLGKISDKALDAYKAQKEAKA